ncbi:stage III sporulation protein AF [Paenibacillus sp. KN14-4R]|uniref:stage III sporulation protein AF n=1 Tax=Paenibacillus sp. KN14-4R TaxID=3445773 RepID=UPI003FA04D80
MAWLNSWLKTVIIIILFASFIDLLLPSAKMHRYVKTVVSLFILLTLLTPVIQLFSKNWNVEKLLASAEAQQNNAGNLRKQGSGMDSVETIMQESERLRAVNSTKAKLLAEQEISETVKQEILKEVAFDVDKVQVTSGLDGDSKPYLQSVAIVLKPLSAAPSPTPTPTASLKKPIASVKPVEIKVKIGKSSNGVQAVGANERTPAMHEAEVAIQKLLQRNWGLDTKKVDVIFLNQVEKS